MFAGMPRGASPVGSMRIASSQLRPRPYQMKYAAMSRHDAQGNRPQRHVEHGARRHPAGAQPPLGDDHGGDDSRDDAQRVDVDRQRADVEAGPAEVRARDAQVHARHYVPAGYELARGGSGFRSAVTELQGVDRNTRGQARMLRRVARHPLQFGSGMGVPLTRGGRGERRDQSARAGGVAVSCWGCRDRRISSGRGARPARGGGDPRRPAAGPDLLPHPLGAVRT